MTDFCDGFLWQIFVMDCCDELFNAKIQLLEEEINLSWKNNMPLPFQKSTKVCNVQKIANIDRFNSFKINSVNIFCINLSNTFSTPHGISITKPKHWKILNEKSIPKLKCKTRLYKLEIYLRCKMRFPFTKIYCILLFNHKLFAPKQELSTICYQLRSWKPI